MEADANNGADASAKLRFSLAVFSLQPSIGRTFLLLVINKHGTEKAMELVDHLGQIMKTEKLSMSDLTYEQRRLLEEADAKINRRDFLGDAAVALVASYLTYDGFKHMNQRGELDEYTWRNMLKNTPDGRDILRGPVELATAVALMGKRLALDERTDERDKISGVARAIDALGEINRANQGPAREK